MILVLLAQTEAQIPLTYVHADISSGAPLLPHFVYTRSECSGENASAYMRRLV